MKNHGLKKVFSIVFLDLLAFSSIVPLLPLLFFQSKFFLKGMPIAHKGFLLGLLYASYPLAQMLSSGLWSRFSDKLGRKNMMRLSFLGNMLGYSFSAYGIYLGKVEFLLLGNTIAGLVGVNISTMNALVSDAFDGPKRAKYFGFIQLILGLAFAIGPWISSFFVEKIPHVETLAFFLFSTAAILALFNSFLISTLPSEKMELVCQASNKMQVKRFDKESLAPLILILCVTIGWYLFIKTFQVFLMQSANFSSKEVLRFISFSGLSMVISQSLFVSFLYKKSTTDRALRIALIGLFLSMVAFMFKPPSILVYLNILSLAFFQSLVMPQLLNTFSKNFSKTVHGKVMSAHMGTVSFGKVIAPLISAMTLLVSPSLSILLGAFFVMVGFVLIPKILKQDEKALMDTLE